jgi:glycosyltransferase involved in cell wall biosynthesis
MKSTPKTHQRICLLAAKNLRWNTRVSRQALSLQASGWRVTIAALERPDSRGLEDIEYVQVTLPRPLRRLERLLRRKRPSPTESESAAFVAAPSKDNSPRLLASISSAIVRAARFIVLPFGHTINSMLFARASTRALAQHRFEVIQAHDAPALRGARSLSRISNALLVYDAVEFVDDRSTFHNTPLQRTLRRFESAAEARIIRRADLSFSIGPSMQQWMVKRYAIATPVVVRNCRWHEQRFSESSLRGSAKLADTDRVVLYMSSFLPGRGVEEFIQALSMLGQEIHAVILGSSNVPGYQQAMLDLGRGLGLSERLHFLSPVPPDELIRYIAGADVGVIPFLNTSMNNFYSLPNRFFEMIMARLPVAVSASPDMQAIVAGFGIGEVFDPQKPNEIASAIRSLLERTGQPALRERLDRAADALCWETESLDYCAALARICDNRKRG